MSARPEDGVVDEFGRAHDVPNLFVCDGSVFTTGAAANPTLTIVALAIRQAEHLASELSRATLAVPGRTSRRWQLMTRRRPAARWGGPIPGRSSARAPADECCAARSRARVHSATRS